jgi:transposase-like protein
VPQTKGMNLVKLIDQFADEDKCREYLEELRWPGGLICPKCGSKSISRISTRSQFDCNSCRYRFSVTSGTMFHDSHLPLSKWFLATYMMIESKKGMSAKQFERSLGVAYRTAWYLCHRVRKAMEEASPIKLRGIVEIDETYVGGKVRGKGKGYIGNKAVVVGAVERDGRIVLKVIPSNDRASLHGFVKEVAAPETEDFYTDEFRAYQGIGDHDTRQETVHHKSEEWVRGDVDTNSVEGVWSLFKRSIIGSYHKVSIKHLDAYLNELEWRFNNRENPWLFRDTLLKLIDSANLEYKTLTA